MTQTTHYAGVLVKIGAERGKLLNENKIKALTETRNITEFTTQLHESSYQQQIAKVSPLLTSKKLERAFTENLIETYIKIIKNSPKNSKTFLRLYLLRFEIENIKVLIKAAYAKLSFEQKIDKIYISFEEFFKHRDIIEETARGSDLRQTVKTLKGTEYASALKMGLGSYETDGSTARFDVLLDKYFYEELYYAYQNLPRKEKPHAYHYVSMEIDGFVLLTLLRGKALHYKPEWLRLAVPTKKLILSEETVEAIVTATDFDSALKIVLESHYAQFFVKTQSSEEVIAKAKKGFDKALFVQAKQSRFTEIFNVGMVLAFLIQKEVEVHNLIAVSLGVEATLKPEDIQRQLLL